MKTLLALLLFCLPPVSLATTALYSIPIKTHDGSPLSLEQFRGKTLLIVNIATKCGFTKQLKGLEELYKKYQDKGLVVIGVPSNDFGGQTPEANAEIAKFCQVNYGVTFPITEKVVVKGSEKHALVAALLEQAQNKAEIKWNFEKFLINSKGHLVQRFSSLQGPDSKDFVKKIEAIL